MLVGPVVIWLILLKSALTSIGIEEGDLRAEASLSIQNKVP